MTLLNPAQSLPRARGELSEVVLELLATAAPVSRSAPRGLHDVATRAASTADVLADDDVQLALALLYELHYRGWGAENEHWEWDPELLAARAVLEDSFEAALRAQVTPPEPEPEAVPAALFEVAAQAGGPDLGRFMARQASVEQFQEVLIHRSVYQLHEADPHSWALPRLSGEPKAALVEIQADEYGGGRPERMHATLFAQTMRGLGLNDSYGAYLDVVSAAALAYANAASLFGLHRRLLGAIVGHLAAVEMTSSLPSRSYSSGLRRLGYGEATRLFYDEHVEADSVHEQIAAHNLAGGLARQQPQLTSDIMFGACSLLALDAAHATEIMTTWQTGHSSLRQPA